jgi:hypothetical protein
VSLLLLSDSGRQLLARQGLLQRAMPLVQQEAAAAAAAAQTALRSAAAAGQAGDAVQELVAALRLGALHARAGMHVLAGSIEGEPAALTEGGCACAYSIVCYPSSHQVERGTHHTLVGTACNDRDVVNAAAAIVPVTYLLGKGMQYLATHCS